MHTHTPAYTLCHFHAKVADSHAPHLAPRGAKNEQAFSGVILKSERPSGPLFTRSGPPFFTFEHKIEALSTLMPSFPHSGPHVLTFCH